MVKGDEKNKVMLIILDGWGYSKKTKGNAVKKAKTLNMDFYQKNYPYTLLKCSGKHVGLPEKQMGNSEMGHMTIGAGRVIDSDIVRINKAIKNKSFFKNKTILKAIQHTKKNNSALHLIGLLSDGGVHSHINHLFALLKLAKQQGIKDRVYIHAILDGRDTLPRSAKKYIKLLFKEIKHLKINASIATIMGRYYGMDRDNRWDRVKKAYQTLTQERKTIFEQRQQLKLINKILDSYYKKRISDEFIPPTTITREKIKQKDSIIFFNFRSDRARELTRAFVKGKFQSFKRKKISKLHFVCLTQYGSKIKASIVFLPLKIKKSLGEILAKQNQLRAAETEKYAHVTFFFNCGREKQFQKEERVLIQSPKVSTYDKKPEMSAFKITNALIKKIKNKQYRLAVVNFANPDMVGHTGNFKAAVKACETVDKCLKKIIKAAKDYTIIITADHGNCEDMAGIHKTSHSLNPVPFIILKKNLKLKKGSLINIAPTILKLLKIKIPKEMASSLN